MVQAKNTECGKLLVKDLKEGDTALIRYEGKANLVFIHRTHSSGNLNMISLTNKREYWSDIRCSNLEVIRVLKHGETLEISNEC